MTELQPGELPVRIEYWHNGTEVSEGRGTFGKLGEERGGVKKLVGGKLGRRDDAHFCTERVKENQKGVKFLTVNELSPLPCLHHQMT